MTRAKYKRKSAKKPAMKVDISVLITAPHATMHIDVDIGKIKTKQMPKLLRQLADVIETGDFEQELAKAMGVETWTHESR